MPNATVATTTRTEPAKNCACVLWRSFGSWPAWYALALTPLVCRYAATVSAWFWNATYTITEPTPCMGSRCSRCFSVASRALAGTRIALRLRLARMASLRKAPSVGMSSVAHRDASVRAVAVAVSASTGPRRRSLERKMRPSR